MPMAFQRLRGRVAVDSEDGSRLRFAKCCAMNVTGASLFGIGRERNGTRKPGRKSAVQGPNLSGFVLTFRNGGLSMKAFGVGYKGESRQLMRDSAMPVAAGLAGQNAASTICSVDF